MKIDLREESKAVVPHGCVCMKTGDVEFLLKSFTFDASARYECIE